jgi:hypothetical protein
MFGLEYLISTKEAFRLSIVKVQSVPFAPETKLEQS